LGLVYRANRGPAAYALLRMLAERQLNLGQSAILDGMFGSEGVRTDFRHLASSRGAAWAGVECSISDPELHRRRIAGRHQQIPGWPTLTGPTSKRCARGLNLGSASGWPWTDRIPFAATWSKWPNGYAEPVGADNAGGDKNSVNHHYLHLTPFPSAASVSICLWIRFMSSPSRSKPGLGNSIAALAI
jgi:hypothetical protein